MITWTSTCCRPDLFTAGVPAADADRSRTWSTARDGPMWSLGGATLGPSGRRGKGLVTQQRPRLPPRAPARPARRHGPRRHLHATSSTARRLGCPIPDLEVRAACLRGVQRLGRRLQRGRPQPARRARAAAVALTRGGDAPSSRGAPRSATAARSSTCSPSDDPAFEDSWEGFWATANELALPISFHLGKGMHSIEVEARAAGACRPVSRCRRCSSTRCSPA